MSPERRLELRTRQLRQSGDAWCAAAEKALALMPGASNSSHPAYSLWLRVHLHREPPVEVVLSSQQAWSGGGEPQAKSETDPDSTSDLPMVSP